MRRLFVALALTGLVTGASAGEFELPDGTPVLRGTSPYVPAPPTFRNWEGLYAGGQVGWGSAHINFKDATAPLAAFQLRELALENEQHVSQWQVLGMKDVGSSSIGGFIGYNMQFDDAVIGLDFHYSKTSFAATAPSFPIGRVTSAGGNSYDVTVNGAAAMSISDWGAIRARGGWVIGNIMPYATVGFAFGRADLSRSVSIVGEQNPPTPPAICATTPTCVPFSFSQSEVKNNAWIYGYSVGTGVDFLIMPNVFLRAEYEYVSFAGVFNTKASINTGRVGAAFKF
jgi:outer membrane immunogenic protein